MAKEKETKATKAKKEVKKVESKAAKKPTKAKKEKVSAVVVRKKILPDVERCRFQSLFNAHFRVFRQN